MIMITEHKLDTFNLFSGLIGLRLIIDPWKLELHGKSLTFQAHKKYSLPDNICLFKILHSLGYHHQFASQSDN